MAAIAIGLWLLTALDVYTSLLIVAADLVVLGFGFGLFSSPNTNAVMSSVEKRSYGVASSVLATMRLTGQMVSMGIVTILFSIHLGGAAITPARYPAFLESSGRAFLVFCVLCIAGVFASLARGRVREGT
jgi:hypothetical protein